MINDIRKRSGYLNSLIRNMERGLLVVQALFAMARPSHLVLITLVYAYGATVAHANGVALDNSALFYGYLALMPISASIHYVNEYADHETDALTVRTPFSGGSGTLPASGLPRKIALAAAWAVLPLGSAVALKTLASGELSPAAIGVLGFGAFWGWMYSLRPLALAWRGWGELDNAMVGGLALPVYGYAVQAGQVEPAVILTFFPFAGTVFINLLATTWADREADAAVGKYTLATRWPVRRLRILYWTVAGSTFVLLPLLSSRILPPVVARASFAVVPVVLWGGRAYTRQHSPFPTVSAMVVMLVVQLAAWWWTIGLPL